jgi:hypothetical protein
LNMFDSSFCEERRLTCLKTVMEYLLSISVEFIAKQKDEC